eukprot:2524479-Pleurochrysis_carterae.AAC.2
MERQVDGVEHIPRHEIVLQQQTRPLTERRLPVSRNASRRAHAHALIGGCAPRRAAARRRLCTARRRRGWRRRSRTA